MSQLTYQLSCTLFFQITSWRHEANKDISVSQHIKRTFKQLLTLSAQITVKNTIWVTYSMKKQYKNLTIIVSECCYLLKRQKTMENRSKRHESSHSGHLSIRNGWTNDIKDSTAAQRTATTKASATASVAVLVLNLTTHSIDFKRNGAILVPGMLDQ